MSAIQGKRILIVEDEFLIATTACEMLQELGALVIGPASTIAEALALTETEDIDAALLDINLHGHSSAAVAARLEERCVPIVFATGYGKGDGKDSMGRYVLGKPYTQEKLAAQLCCALAQAD